MVIFLIRNLDLKNLWYTIYSVGLNGHLSLKLVLECSLVCGHGLAVGGTYSHIPWYSAPYRLPVWVFVGTLGPWFCHFSSVNTYIQRGTTGLLIRGHILLSKTMYNHGVQYIRVALYSCVHVLDTIDECFQNSKMKER